MEAAHWPSIRSYVDRELQLRETLDDTWELRYGDVLLGRLGDTRYATVECTTRDGVWVFTRERGGDIEATQGTAVVARYESGLMPGGPIELVTGARFKLRPPIVGETWRIRNLVDFKPEEGVWSIGFGERAREVYELPLLTMLALRAILSEHRYSGDGGGAAVGPLT